MSRSPAKSSPSSPTKRVTSILHDLSTPTSQDLTILRLSEPITTALQSSASTADTSIRTSDVSSASALDAPTPASLEADLQHYRELFAKLRFSYVEQVTKEKFIRAIVGDPPLIVTPQENADLEAENMEAKKALKGLKTSVAELVEGLEGRARDLAVRWERVESERELLRGLPGKVEGVEGRIGELREELKGMEGEGREGSMPLGKTLALVEERGREVKALERQLEMLGGSVPRKRKERERLEMELTQLEAKRANSTAAAREAKRRKEDAQGQDDLEAKGRWYRATEQVLTQVLDIQG